MSFTDFLDNARKRAREMKASLPQPSPFATDDDYLMDQPDNDLNSVMGHTDTQGQQPDDIQQDPYTQLSQRPSNGHGDSLKMGNRGPSIGSSPSQSFWSQPTPNAPLSQNSNEILSQGETGNMQPRGGGFPSPQTASYDRNRLPEPPVRQPAESPTAYAQRTAPQMLQMRNQEAQPEMRFRSIFDKDNLFGPSGFEPSVQDIINEINATNGSAGDLAGGEAAAKLVRSPFAQNIANDQAQLPPGGRILQETDPRMSDPSMAMQPRMWRGYNLDDLGEQLRQKHVRGEQAPLSGTGGVGAGDDLQNYDPMAIARRQVGPQKKRSPMEVARDIFLGFTGGGGLGGAVAAGVKGGDVRYNNALRQKAAEIEYAKQAQRQAMLDKDNSAYKQAQTENLVEREKRALALLEEQKRRNREAEADRDAARGDLKTYREREAAQKENDTKSKEKRQRVQGYIGQLNRKGLTQEDRADLIARLHLDGFDLPQGYNPNNDDLDFRVDPSSGEAYIINRSRGTSKYVENPEGDGTLTLQPKQPQGRGHSGGRGGGKPGSKGSDWVIIKNKFTGLPIGSWNKVTNEYREFPSNSQGQK